MWLGLRYFTEEMSASVVDMIEAGTPNRLAYFDQQNFDLYPLGSSVDVPVSGSLWLAGFGFLGLLGAALRRRQAAVR